jgi:cation:H+ antiporter
MVWLEGLMPWAIFLASAAVIVYAGAKLAHYGDPIAILTGLGGLWIGVVLMAGATSLPEIFTDVSAALLDVPDLAAGDLFGSNMANMLILGLIDLLHRQKRVWQQATLQRCFRHPCQDGSVEHRADEHRPDGDHLSGGRTVHAHQT